MKKALLLSPLILLVFSACATNQTKWWNPHGGDYARDAAQCDEYAQAKKMSAVNTIAAPNPSSMGIVAADAYNRAFDSCMSGKGWKKVNIPEPQQSLSSSGAIYIPMENCLSSDERRLHKGKFVVLTRECAVVTYGDSPSEALEAAKRLGIAGPTVLQVSPVKTERSIQPGLDADRLMLERLAALRYYLQKCEQQNTDPEICVQNGVGQGFTEKTVFYSAGPKVQQYLSNKWGSERK